MGGVGQVTVKANGEVEFKNVTTSGSPTGGRRDIKVTNDLITLATGDGQMEFAIPHDLNGLNLTRAEGFITTLSSSGDVTVQIRNITQAVDILSTEITIDQGDFTSYTAGVPSVVDTSNDQVFTSDIISIDVDSAGVGAKGLGVILFFDSDPPGFGAIGPTGATGATGATGSSSDYAKVSDHQTQNTAGGTFTTGAWRTRTINTEDSDTASLVTLSSNQMTLVAGTYIVRARAPGFACGRHRIRLQNITDATTVLLGGNGFYSGSTTGTDAVLAGKFTIAASKALEIQHQCEVTAATNGLGVATNFAAEIYTEVEFWKQ